jgi:hypothetical protein
MITGDRSEVKQTSCAFSNNLDPRGPIDHDSPLSFIRQERRGNRIPVFFVYTGCSQILASDTDGVLTSLPIVSLALVGRTGRHYVAREIYAEYDAAYQRFGDTCCVHL